MSVRYRLMRHDDIAVGLGLCRASRWNQLARDWELFLELSPRGCLIAESDGRGVGTVTTVRYEDRFAWIGMVLVDPSARGHGIGTSLLEQAIDLLRDMSSIRLDATPAGYPIYTKIGFKEEYRLSRMEAVIDSNVIAASDVVSRMSAQDLCEVFEGDRQVFGADRSRILTWMREGASEYAWVKRDAGFLFGRHGYNFEHLGPVVADSDDSARELISACLRGLDGRRVIIDTPCDKTVLRLWLESLGFAEQRPFIRMFLGSNPLPGRPAEQFAILGPEFG